MDDDFDFTGGHVWVGLAVGAGEDGAGNLENPFGTNLLGEFVSLGVLGGVEFDLGEAVTVAEVDEDEVTVVSAAVDPAGEGDLLVCVFGAEFAASVGAEHG